MLSWAEPVPWHGLQIPDRPPPSQGTSLMRCNSFTQIGIKGRPRPRIPTKPYLFAARDPPIHCQSFWLLCQAGMACSRGVHHWDSPLCTCHRDLGLKPTIFHSGPVNSPERNCRADCWWNKACKGAWAQQSPSECPGKSQLGTQCLNPHHVSTPVVTMLQGMLGIHRQLRRERLAWIFGLVPRQTSLNYLTQEDVTINLSTGGGGGIPDTHWVYTGQRHSDSHSQEDGCALVPRRKGPSKPKVGICPTREKG